MLVGDSVLDMRRAQWPEYSLVRGDQSQGGLGDIIFGTDSQVGPRAVTSPGVSKARSHESGGDLRRARGGEHYYRLSDDKVKQSDT